jgi:hypothetical protein
MDDALPPATSARSRVIASAGCCCAGHGALGVATQERRGRWDNDALQRRAEESLTRFVWQCSANASAVQKHANQQAQRCEPLHCPAAYLCVHRACPTSGMQIRERRPRRCTVRLHPSTRPCGDGRLQRCRFLDSPFARRNIHVLFRTATPFTACCSAASEQQLPSGTLCHQRALRVHFAAV